MLCPSVRGVNVYISFALLIIRENSECQELQTRIEKRGRTSMFRAGLEPIITLSEVSNRVGFKNAPYSDDLYLQQMCVMN